MRNFSIIAVLLTLLRISMGLFFLTTAVLKVGDLGETADFLTRSRLLPEFCSLPLACTGVAMEMLVGLALVTRRVYQGATLWGMVMCSVFLMLYIQAWARGLELSCNCMGSTHEIVNYPLDTGLRLLLLGGMMLLFWDSARVPSTSYKPKQFDFSDAVL